MVAGRRCYSGRRSGRSDNPNRTSPATVPTKCGRESFGVKDDRVGRKAIDDAAEPARVFGGNERKGVRLIGDAFGIGGGGGGGICGGSGR